MTTRMLATMATAVVASIGLVAPTTSIAQDEGPGDDPVTTTPLADPAPEPAALSVRVKGLRGGKRPAFRRTVAIGWLRPFVAGQRVLVEIVGRGKMVKRKRVRVRRVGNGRRGRFRLASPRLRNPGRYRVRARKSATSKQAAARGASRRFRLRYPSLRRGNGGLAVRLLNRQLRRQGYEAPKGRRFTTATADAVLTFRKVNRMAWTRRSSPRVLGRLLRGKGAFRLRRPGAGRHVEVDRSRQVMVLASGGKARHTFHISSGKRSTPSDRGHFRFYRRQPGYNRLGMYYSVYYNRGEAIHGFRSVPTYPASHGCVRSPIRQARFIYNWVRLGMSVYVY